MDRTIHTLFKDIFFHFFIMTENLILEYGFYGMADRLGGINKGIYAQVQSNLL